MYHSCWGVRNTQLRSAAMLMRIAYLNQNQRIDTLGINNKVVLKDVLGHLRSTGGFLGRLEGVQEDIEVLGLLSKVADDDTVATNDVLGNTILIDLAKTNPLTKLLTAGNLDQLDLVLGTEGLDQTGVLGLVAGLSEDTEVSLTAIQGLDGLTDTTGKTIVLQGATEDLNEGGLGGDLTDDDGNGLFDNDNISFC